MSDTEISDAETSDTETKEWFAIITNIDTDDYKAGSVVSFGTVKEDDTELEKKGLEAFSIGNHPDTGPDFKALEFDPITKTLVPIATPPDDSVDILINNTSWSEKERDDAMRLVLKLLFRK